jgi:hypothetical protein
MKTKPLVVFISLVSTVFFFSERIFADDATVLPKGRFMFSLDSKFYLPIDERFNENGDTEDLAIDLNANLNGSVFPQLSLIEQGFGMPTGSATLGNSIVSFE